MVNSENKLKQIMKVFLVMTLTWSLVFQIIEKTEGGKVLMLTVCQ